MAMASNMSSLSPLKRAPTLDMAVPEMDDVFALDEQYDDSRFNVKPKEFDDILALFQQHVEVARETQDHKMLEIQKLRAERRRDVQNLQQVQGYVENSADDEKRLKDEERRINNEHFTKFGQERKSMWHCKTLDGRNFLHYLAYQPWSRSSSYPLWLITLAILQRPELMGALDNKRRTPLTGKPQDCES